MPPQNSTPSLLKKHQAEVSDKEKTLLSIITKTDDYINKKYDQMALEHL